MKLNFKMVTLAALAMLAGGAQAAVANSTAGSSMGNSSLLFVAVDVNSNAGLVIDLGLSMSDFTNVPSAALPQGNWNFATDSTSFGSATGNSWSAAYNSFKSAQSGGDLLWGVVAGDQVTGAVSATNPIAGRGLLATGNPTAANMTSVTLAGPTGTALTNFSLFVATAANLGTMTTANNGAAATTSANGEAWLPVRMGDKFGGSLAWSYLLANGAVSNFQWQQNLTANPVVFQLGNPTATDSLAASPLTFSFDIATNTLVAAVPEPSTYAMLIAGLVAVGFMARRRQA